MAINFSKFRLEAVGFPGSGAGRDRGIDALKGFAILLVVLGHSLEIADPGLFVPNASFRHHLAILIYAFHMPLFMFLAGYVASGKKAKVGKNFMRLIVPFFTWMLVKFFIFTPPAKFGELGSYVGNGVWSMANAPLWFLWVLFFCYMLLIPAQHAAKLHKYGEELALFVLFIAVNLVPSARLGINSLQFYFAFFALGYLSAKYKGALAKLKPEFKRAVLASSPAFFLVLFFASYSGIGKILLPATLMDLFVTPGMFIIRYGLAAFGILSAFSLLSAIKALKGKKVEAVLAWLGLATLDIYVAHGILIHLSFGNNWVKVFSAFTIGVAGSLALTYVLLRNWRVLSIPFLGKNYQHGPRYRLTRAPEAVPAPAAPIAPVVDLGVRSDSLPSTEVAKRSQKGA